MKQSRQQPEQAFGDFPGLILFRRGQLNLAGNAMKTLPAADAMAFEEHLLICACCRAAVEAADVYVRATREAAGEMRRAG